MSGFQPGVYIFRPRDAGPRDNLTTAGPATLPDPPPDVPIRVNNGGQFWTVKRSKDNTFNVFSGAGKSTDYKWIVKYDALVASVRNPIPGDFRIESAGNGFWLPGPWVTDVSFSIGIPDKDLILTYDPEAFPPLPFKPADGSSAQRFEAIRIDRY